MAATPHNISQHGHPLAAAGLSALSLETGYVQRWG